MHRISGALSLFIHKRGKMIIIDNLYGAFEAPDWLTPIFLSPEVQRLRGVRLINTSSSNCPSLSDVHRYTHTMGVLYLASKIRNRFIEYFSSKEFNELLVAILLHDVGTPPFGHIFEYQLRALKGWDHEKIVSDIVYGTYRPEKRYHQIYFNNTLRLRDELEYSGLNIESILSIIRGDGLKGKVLSNSIDLDNIDNVVRMSLHLGLNIEKGLAGKLVEFFMFKEDSILFDRQSIPLIQEWLAYRQKAYHILLFDECILSGQAMLSECLSIALQNELIGEEHWFLND